jgi:hypothetical protein
MTRVIAVVIAVGLISGCTSSRASKSTVYLGGGVVFAGLLVAGDADGNGDKKDAGFALIGTGVVIAALGVVGLLVFGTTELFTGGPSSPPPQQPVVMQPPPPMADPQAADLDRKRRAAWDLTQQARTAAYANDCARVAYLAQRVIELDRGTFDTVFSRDQYIVKCAPKPPQDPPRSIPIPPLNPTPPPAPPPLPTEIPD